MKDEHISKSQARRIKEMIQLQKGLLRRRQSLTDFKEPIAWLIRRNGNVEFYESATKGRFTFKHSDGETRYIDLVPARIKSFDYAGRKIRGYILQEDSPTPIPEDPVVTTELISISQEKSMHDINKFKAKEELIKGKNIKIILLGIAAIIGVFILGAMLIPESFWDKILGKDIPPPAAPVEEQPLLGIGIIGVQYLINRWKVKNG